MGETLLAQRKGTAPPVLLHEVDILNRNTQDLREFYPFSPGINVEETSLANVSEGESFKNFAVSTVGIARNSKPIRYAGAATASAVLALTGRLTKAPQTAQAVPERIPPELTLRQLINVASFTSGVQCRYLAKQRTEAGGGTLNEGKCGYIFLRNCVTGGPRGQAQYDPPLHRNEGFCKSSFVISFTSGEPVEKGDLQMVCSSFKVGVYLVKGFRRGRDGRIETYWHPAPDTRARRWAPFRCIDTRAP